jgi:hypothetical protein
MLTKKIANFSDDLLNTVLGILGEAKKCPADCECEKCEAEEMKEGSMPTADEPTDANKKTADKVRAMLAKEKKPVKEDAEQIDEISSDMAHRYLKGKRERDYDISPDGKSSKLKKPQSFDKMNKDAKSSIRALRTIEKAKKANEDVEHTNCGTPDCCGQCDTAEPINETAKIVAHLQKRYGDNIRKSHIRSAASDFGVDASKLAKAVRAKLGKNMLGEEEQISEISKGTLGRYINKAKDSIDTASYRQGHKEAHGSSSKPLEKKLTKRHKGISTAVNKLTKEDAEQIDELSSKTLFSYGKKARKEAEKRDEPMHRARGRLLASKKTNPARGGYKLTKVAATFGEESEQIDELSKATLGSYVKKAQAKTLAHGMEMQRNIDDFEDTKDAERKVNNRFKGVSKAVNKLTKEEQDFVDSLNDETFEEVEITEARGRPKKAGAKDFTIHPKTKEKLMHNNPEHMKKIEALQKNGILEKPKVEAGQHIMNQLRKAKTSMLGGSKINFTHGDSKEVSGTHAAKILTKYAGMKPDEKENFQKFVGHSHENLMKHV